MSKLQKTIDRLSDLQQVFTFNELEYLLGKFGYKEKRTGKTSASRKAYVNSDSLHIIRINKPHPGNEIKRYIRAYLIIEFQKQDLI